MKSIALAAVGIALSVGTVNAADALTVDEATALVTPYYQLFNATEAQDIKAVHEQVFADDYQSCAGYLPSDCYDRNTSIQVIGGFASMVPDLKVELKDVIVSGNQIIVRAQANGTPAGEFFGVPHTGKSFEIMTIDILKVEDGKIAHTYHLENWAGALAQLTAP